MSMYIYHFNDHAAYVAADSRVCCTIEGEQFKMNDDCNKILAIPEKKMILTFAGREGLVRCVQLEFKERTPAEQTIENLQFLCKLICGCQFFLMQDYGVAPEIIEQLKAEDHTYDLEVCCILYDPILKKNMFYQLSSYNDFEIVEQNCGDSVNLTAYGGINIDEAEEYFSNRAKTTSDTMLPMLLSETYNYCCDERVGGTLTWYRMEKGVVTGGQYPIVDKTPPRLYQGTTNDFFRLNGKTIIGKKLKMHGVRSDGHTTSFTADETGLDLYNASLRIHDDTIEGNGVTLKTYLDRTEEDDTYGLIITRNNKKFRTVMNADDGIYFQKGDGTGTWTAKNLEIDTNGNITAEGIIKASDFYIGSSSISALIAASQGSTGVEQIKGEYLYPAGLTIKSGNREFTVDEDAIVTIKNGLITMTYGTGSTAKTITINPSTGLVFKNGSEEVLKLDITDGSAVFAGDINTKQDAYVGENIYVGSTYEHGRIYFAGTGTSNAGYIDVDVSGDKTMTIASPTGDDIIMTSSGTYLNSVSNSNRIITQSKITDLQSQIDNLQSQINALKGV